jgi:2'-5' RNA ligase
MSFAPVNNASVLPDRLFFAVRLPPDAAAQAAQLRKQLRDQHRLSGSEVRTDLLHITLHWLDDYRGLPAEIVTSALMAGGLVKTPPFDVVMNRVHSYPDGGLALSSNSVAALRDFQKQLGNAMDKAGIGRLKRATFKPHVTLLYDNHPIESTPIVPIWWTVREFALIHSLQGQSRHIVLGEWQLREKQMRLEGF